MSDDAFEGWAILEMMGHRRLAGYVREQEIAGAGMLRLDIYGSETGDVAVATQFYSPSALYCLTPTTEDIARKLGERLRPAPVTRYEIEPPKPRDEYRPGTDDGDDDEYGYDLDGGDDD